MIIYLDQTVTDKQAIAIEEMVGDLPRHKPSFGGVEVSIEKAQDYTYVDGGDELLGTELLYFVHKTIEEN